jgi:hypothetical protein
LLFSMIFAIPKPAAIPIIAEITIVNMSMFVKIYIKAYINCLNKLERQVLS